MQHRTSGSERGAMTACLFVVIGALTACSSTSPDPEPTPVAATTQATKIRINGFDPARVGANWEYLKVDPIPHDEVNGARIEFAVDGTVDDVMDMLVDFENAAGNRAWAQAYETVSSDGDTVVASWEFEGKLGINPTCQIEFVRDVGPPRRLTYRVVKKAIGIARFFGEYEVHAYSLDPPQSVIVQTIHIDSGLPFVNATPEDLECGLREDARLIRPWMTERVHAKGLAADSEAPAADS